MGEILERKITKNDAKMLDLILRSSKWKNAEVIRLVLNLPSFNEKTRNELKRARLKGLL